MTQIVAGRWQTNTTGSELLEYLPRVQQCGIRWSLESYGLERIELTIDSRNRYEVYQRLLNHLGQRLCVLSDWSYNPIGGFISEVRPLGQNRIQYIAKGAAWRLKNELDTTLYDPTDTIQTVMQNVIDTTNNLNDVVTTNQTLWNIAANATTVGGWQTRQPGGSYPYDIIRDLLRMSDGSNNVYDFWLEDRPLQSDLTASRWVPNYEARSATASFNWQVNLRDLSELVLGRDINDLATNATVYYGTLTGTDTTGSGNQTLNDAAATFQTDGVQEGDRVTNYTDSSTGIVDNVASETQLVVKNLSGGTNDFWSNNDVYAIQIKDPTKASTTATTTAAFWDVDKSDYITQLDSTQANQYAETLISNEAVQVQSFTVTAPKIRDGNGVLWPLWEVIAQGGGYIRVNDLYPEAAIFSDSRNQITTFRITALDYDYTSNALRVNVEVPDIRLDAVLQRANILRSAIVNRGR